MKNEQKQTPGPWRVGGDGYERKRSDGTPWRSLNLYGARPTPEETGRQVAEVCIDKGCDWWEPEARANARLIAACPTMCDYVNKKALSGDSEAMRIISEINANEER